MSVSFHVSVFEYCTRIIEALQGLNFNVQLLSVEDVLSVVATFCTIHQSQLVIGDSVDFNIVVGSVQQRYCHLQNRISPYSLYHLLLDVILNSIVYQERRKSSSTGIKTKKVLITDYLFLDIAISSKETLSNPATCTYTLSVTMISYF